MKIILIGFMGSGKSLTAKQLASRLQLRCYDMDQMVFEQTQTSNMEELFARGGESLLRKMEALIAKTLKTVHNCIIATGGGVVQTPCIMDDLQQGGGIVVYLDCSFALCAERAYGKSGRPLFQDLAAAQALYTLRRSLYLSYANQIVQTDGKSVELIVQEIVG